VILGQVVYSQGSCVPDLGVKAFSEWTSVYIASPNIPASVLRGVARFANVHLYNEDGDIIYASQNLFGIHTVSGGMRTFRFPIEAKRIYDMFNEKEIVCNSACFQVKLDPISSRLFYIEYIE